MRVTSMFFIVAGLLLLGGGGAVIYNQTRGLRNNNPGNIRRSSDQWQGMAAEQKDKDFVTFVSPEYGIRAMTVILAKYRTRYGLRSIRQIIARWAPPTENDTDAYIASVVSYTGRDPDQVLTDADMPQLVAAIIKHENGIQPYDVALIDQGIALA